MVGEVSEHYRILEERHEDEFTALYKAMDIRLNRLVLVEKLPALGAADSREPMLGYLEEAWASTIVEHPSILPVHAVLDIAGKSCVVLDYARGRLLDRWIARHQLNPERALRFATQIAEALEAAHAAGLYHGALRPASVLITETGKVRLFEFGMHHLAEGLGGRAAPERRAGAPPDASSDIYSLGALLSAMFTGLPADSSVKSIIETCLAEDPAQRYASVADFRRALAGPHEFESVRISSARRFVRRMWSGRPKYWQFATAAAIAVACVAGLWLWIDPADYDLSSADSRAPFRPITSGAGLATEPAIAPDGTAVIWAADEPNSPRLSLWMKRLPKGRPRRLTDGSTDDHEPCLTPDGKMVVFRSERAAGGLWVMPVKGGAPRLLVEGGRRPRVSPGGDEVVYWARRPSPASAFDRGEVYVVPLAGGTPRRVAGDLDSALFPVWSPDGRSVLLVGRNTPEGRAEWFVAPAAGGPSARLGLLETLLASRVRCGPPAAWLLGPERLLFTADHGRGPQLVQLPVSVSPWRIAGAVEDLGPPDEAIGSPSAAVSGAAVYARLSGRVAIRRAGIGRSGSEGGGGTIEIVQSAVQPSVSRDGRYLAYVSSESGKVSVWLKELGTGATRNLTAIDWIPAHPVISAAGFVLFGSAGAERLARVPVAGGPVVQVCKGCSSLPWDITPDGRSAIVRRRLGSNTGAGLLDIESGEVSGLLESEGSDITDVALSRDGAWVTFTARREPWRGYIAPFHGGRRIAERSWIPISSGSGWEGKQRWSAGGDALYFLARRDGFRCVWAQRLDPETKVPSGEPVPVLHSHGSVESFEIVPLRDFEMALSKDGLLFTVARLRGNVWYSEIPRRASERR